MSRLTLLLLPATLLLVSPAVAQPSEQPCRIWSVPEAMSYKGLCKVMRKGSYTSLSAPHALSGQRKTIELSPSGRRRVDVQGRNGNGTPSAWGEARKVGKSCWVGSDFGLCL